MVKTGVIGYGYWGPNIVRNLYDNPGYEVKWVCDLDQGRLDAAKRRYPAVNVTRDFKEMMEDEEVQAVFVVTRVSEHYPLAREALLKGKDCFVEKPLTSSSTDAEDLVRTAKEKGLILMVGHTFEYSPPVVKVKEILSKGDLGEVYFISSSRVNLGIHQKDISVIWDLAAHDLSMILYWLEEEPVTVAALGKASIIENIPDVAFVNIAFPSGVIANVEVSWLAPTKLRRTTIVGSKKMLVYDDTESLEKVRVFDKGVDFRDPRDFREFQLSYRTGDIVSPVLENYEPLQAEVSHFLDCLRLRRQPKSDGLSGLRVVKALELVEESLKNGGSLGHRKE